MRDISVGVRTFILNFTNGAFGYLGKKGNKWYENLGYGLGAMANLADLGKAGNLLLNTEKKDVINHSAILDENGNTIISEGPGKNWIEPKGTVDHYLNRFLGGSGATNEYSVHGENMAIKNVNVTTIKNYGKVLDFLTGSSGTKKSNKELYFDMHEKHSTNANSPCDNGTLYIFNASQKEGNGGYDAAIVYWSKFLVPVEQVIKRLKNQR